MSGKEEEYRWNDGTVRDALEGIKIGEGGGGGITGASLTLLTAIRL